MLFLARLCFACRISMSVDIDFMPACKQALFHIVLNSAASVNIWKLFFTHTDSTNFVLDVEDGLLQVFYLFVLVFHPLLMFKSCPP